MSNARSPREVCSTTIGTSGLTVLASFRFSRSNPSGKPARTRPPSASARGRSLDGTVATANRRPNRYERLGGGLGSGLCRDRLGGVGDGVERLALREVLLDGVEPPGRLQPFQ